MQDVRIAVPAERPDPASCVDPVLAQAQFVVIYDTHNGSWDTLDSWRTLENPGGAGAALAELLSRHRVDVVLCEEYGPPLYHVFQSVGIRLRDGASGSVREAIDRYLAPKTAARAWRAERKS
ncbi:MAG: NifB/NifX family molybdenum-iron cluster-binding protein [Symbiobacterium sp.]|uniref:NifB/NifX family molybdenum-iron cluster-binding protein n=1 Tax=Symbiobacterium sp. TaxID=1971213 RepID=UPI0034647CCC